MTRPKELRRVTGRTAARQPARLDALRLHRPPDWAGRAACADHDPSWWFPLPGDRATFLRARDICRDCPVKYPCLTYAYANDEAAGIWGGLSFERDKHRGTG